MKIPNFIRSQHDSSTINKILNSDWEVRSNRILAVKDSNIVLLYGVTTEGPGFETIARLHNENRLLGMSDEEYNNAIPNL